MQTPTFYHTTVLLKEAVDALAIKADGVYVDATFGGGGHSREILSRLGSAGKLIAFDHDSDAWRNKPEDDRLTQVSENFRYIKRFVRLFQLYGKVDGILADLGVSSWQFDTAERGFSIRFNGPLDMRMDERLEKTAADIIATYSESELQRVFEEFGEVRNARQLAKHIVQNRGKGKVADIEGFKGLIAPVIKGNPQKYLAQLFQALRIEVNGELEALKDFLEQATECLNVGGRLSVITFHSLEDRVVKTFMKRGIWEDELNEFGQITNKAFLRPLIQKPIEPSIEETRLNTRARSAKLRIAERV
jgi:16S rRNA (cytosine1402-N4)-methyltransferase